MNKDLGLDRKAVQKLRDSVLTLENYSERYIPLVVLNTVMELMQPVLEDQRLKKFNKAYDKQRTCISKSILED